MHQVNSYTVKVSNIQHCLIDFNISKPI